MQAESTTTEIVRRLQMNMDNSLTLNFCFFDSFRITDNQIHLHDMFFGSVTMQYASRNCTTTENARRLQMNMDNSLTSNT